MLLTPVSSPRAQQQPGFRVRVGGMHVLGELARLNGDDLQRAGHLHRAVDARELIGIVGVLDQPLEPQQRGESLPIQGETRSGECAGAERTGIHPAPGLPQALAAATEHRANGQEVVRERGGLGLHAVGVGGHDRVFVLARAGGQRHASGPQGVDLAQQSVAQVHARQRRGEILAAAAGVQPRGFGPADLEQARLVVEVVRGRARRGCAIAGAQLGDRPRDAPRSLARDDGGVGEHHEGGGVDLVEELDRAAAAAEGLVEVPAHRCNPGCGAAMCLPCAAPAGARDTARARDLSTRRSAAAPGCA